MDEDDIEELLELSPEEFVNEELKMGTGSHR